MSEMSEYKCAASIDGVCRNIFGNGTRCNGFSKECTLRQHCENLSNVANHFERSIKNAFGIKGDLE